MTAIRDVMTENPITVAPEVPAAEAAHLMRDADVGVLPVVVEGLVEGVITDRDLAIHTAAPEREVRVADIMSRMPVAVSPDDSIDRAEALMAEHGVRRLLVCDGSRLVGIISVGDLATRVSDVSAGEVMHETGPRGSAAPAEASPASELPSGDPELAEELAPGLGAESVRAEDRAADQFE